MQDDHSFGRPTLQTADEGRKVDTAALLVPVEVGLDVSEARGQEDVSVVAPARLRVPGHGAAHLLAEKLCADPKRTSAAHTTQERNNV